MSRPNSASADLPWNTNTINKLITLHESTSASQVVVWLIIFGSIAVLANGVLFGLMWRRAGARSLLYRTLILFDGIYGLACLLVVMMFYGPLSDCNTTTLYNITSQHVGSKDAAVITDEMRGTGCTVAGASLPLDIAAFFVTLSSRVPSAVLLALTVTWLYKMMVGKPCRMLAVLPVILWTVLWCLMALASLATILNFAIVLRYEDDNGSTMMIDEKIARRDSLYRTLTNNPLPLGSRSNTELLVSPYLLNLVFSFQIPLLLASIGGISAAVLGVIRKDSLKKGSGAIHIAVMTTFSLVMSAPMFIYIASGWSKVQPGKDYNPDTYLVFVYTVLLPLVAAAGRGVTQLSCKTWQKCGSNKQAGITIENEKGMGMSEVGS